MKQTPEQRRLHHQTRDDRRRKVFDELQRRIFFAANKRTGLPFNVEAARRDAANLAVKLNIQV